MLKKIDIRKLFLSFHKFCILDAALEIKQISLWLESF